MNADVDNERCPRCAALVRRGSSWCTLCYADLRPVPVPPPVEAAVPSPSDDASDIAASGVAAGVAFDPLTAPLALLERASGEQLSGEPGSDGQLGESSVAPKPAYWPCLRCGANISIEESACTSCGAGFLETPEVPRTATHGLRLGAGEISNQTKALIMIGGSLGLLVVLLGLMYLLGTVF